MNMSLFQGEPRVYQDEKNEYGCSLQNQKGSMGVQDFDAIVERLSPALRAAFEAERAACSAELQRFPADGAAAYYDSAIADLARRIKRAKALVQRTWIERFRRKVGQFDIPELIANFFPRIAAH